MLVCAPGNLAQKRDAADGMVQDETDSTWWNWLSGVGRRHRGSPDYEKRRPDAHCSIARKEVCRPNGPYEWWSSRSIVNDGLNEVSERCHGRANDWGATPTGLGDLRGTEPELGLHASGF